MTDKELTEKVTKSMQFITIHCKKAKEALKCVNAPYVPSVKNTKIIVNPNKR